LPATKTTAATATATTAPTAKSTAATATATTGPVFTGLGFIDGQRPAIVILAVEGSDRLLSFFVCAHFDEPETFTASGFPVADDFGALYRSMRREH
jgi:hypothetical protein